MTDTLLMIYTGGTIGMQHSEDGFSAAGGFAELLQSKLSSDQLEQLGSYQVLELERPIDSSNAQPQDWLTLATIIQQQYHSYAGFIVVHGTDTMAYSAAALHHMLPALDKPVILTGSQIPLICQRSDGLGNLIDAACYARSGKINQVALCFNHLLFAGHQCSKVHSSDFQAFNSPNAQPLASGAIQLQFNHSQLRPAAAVEFNLPTKPLNQVAVLYLHPGISDTVIEASLNPEKIQAAIIYSFGAGNLADANPVLMSALEKAASNGVKLINRTQCHQGSTAQGDYAVSQRLNQLGVINGENRTLEDLVTELTLFV